MCCGKNVPDMTAVHILNSRIHQFHPHVDRHTPTNEGSKKPVGTVYVGIASKYGWANAIQTQIGGTRAENKAGFVYFALLTAMQCWEDAMVRKEELEREEQVAIEEAMRLAAEREAERERRDMEAREKAPWQDEAWSEEAEGEEIGLEVEWSEDQEE